MIGANMARTVQESNGGEDLNGKDMKQNGNGAWEKAKPSND